MKKQQHQFQFFTTWKQGEKKGRYTTFSLTDYHKSIHKNCDYAMTCKVDLQCLTPLGPFTEIIAISGSKNPKNNKPFAS